MRMKLSPIQYSLFQLRQNSVVSCLTGNYKEFVKTHKELAAIAVKHFDEFVKIPSMEKVNFSLFSPEGFNSLKVIIKDLFRKKTPEEKLFSKMIYESKLKKLINKP